MSCFWDGLINELRRTKLLNGNQNPSEFVNFLKQNNVETKNVLWQGNPLTDKQIDENIKHIKNYNVSTIGHGYDCSVADPFLFLVCFLFKVDIRHRYLNTNIEYSYKNDSCSTTKLLFNSSHSHFQAG